MPSSTRTTHADLTDKAWPDLPRVLRPLPPGVQGDGSRDQLSLRLLRAVRRILAQCPPRAGSQTLSCARHRDRCRLDLTRIATAVGRLRRSYLRIEASDCWRSADPRPVDLRKELVDQIYMLVMNPVGWSGLGPDDEQKQASFDALAAHYMPPRNNSTRFGNSRSLTTLRSPTIST